MNLKKIWYVYFGGFLLGIHYASVAYINSSLIQNITGNVFLNVLYIIASIFSLIFLILAPFFLKKYGNKITLLVFTLIEIFSVFGIGSSELSILILVLFIIQSAAEPMLYFCLDVNLEHETKNENTTGNKRGIFLTIQNLAWVISPILVGLLVDKYNFNKVYFLSGISLVPLFLITHFFFSKTKKTEDKNFNIKEISLQFKQKKDKIRVIGTQFILNFFYSWMMIYLPLTLTKEVGFSWDKIGIIFTIMLIPFLIFELPMGILGDKKMGEKEFLIGGFIIMSMATFLIPFIEIKSILIWSIVLFITRIGASLVEISSESYFFKNVKEDDTGLISLFRMARPLSFIIAPLIALPVIYFFDYSTSFYFLSVFTIMGLFFVPKVDTK